MTTEFIALYRLSVDAFVARLDYQPLFGKMTPHSPPGKDQRLVKDRTRETAEIEPTLLLETVTSKQ